MGQVASGRKRVVIVDDSRTMQAFLEHILSTRLRCDVVGIAGDGAEAVGMINRLRPDLVTIDLAMPYINGQQLLTALKAFPNMRKVVISASVCDNLSMKSSLESMGADICICKREMSQDTDEFCRTLASVLRAPAKPKTAVSAVKASAPIPTMGYPVPVDEHERLDALATLGLANDDADRRLDMLTEHLVKTTSFSACVMTFIDQHMQWTKSGYGLERGSTVRGQAICNYTICGDEPFIVHDTHMDKRFANLDAVKTGPKIRSYVGYPIIGFSGIHLGAICLLDTKPRRVSLKELTNLRSIAGIAAELIEGCPALLKRAA